MKKMFRIFWRDDKELIKNILVTIIVIAIIVIPIIIATWLFPSNNNKRADYKCEDCDCDYKLAAQRDKLMQKFEERLNGALRYYRYNLGDECYIYNSSIYYKCDQGVVEEARSTFDKIEELLKDVKRGNI